MVFVSVGLAAGAGLMGSFGEYDGVAITHVLAELTLIVVLFTDASRIRFRELESGYGLPLRLLAVGMPVSLLTRRARRRAGVPRAAVLVVLRARRDPRAHRCRARAGRRLQRARAAPDPAGAQRRERLERRAFAPLRARLRRLRQHGGTTRSRRGWPSPPARSRWGPRSGRSSASRVDASSPPVSDVGGWSGASSSSPRSRSPFSPTSRPSSSGATASSPPSRPGSRSATPLRAWRPCCRSSPRPKASSSRC